MTVLRVRGLAGLAAVFLATPEERHAPASTALIVPPGPSPPAPPQHPMLMRCLPRPPPGLHPRSQKVPPEAAADFKRAQRKLREEFTFEEIEGRAREVFNMFIQ